MKLQACTKCGAQFDVSSFSVGQQFSCGACGEVLTAHAAAPAAPPAAPPVAKAAGGKPKRTPGAARSRAPGAARSRTPGAPAKGAGAPAPAGRRAAGAKAKGRAPGTGRGAAPAGRSRKAVSGGPAAPSKGPQYQPVQRAGGGGGAKAPAVRKTAAPAGRRARRGASDEEGDGPARRGSSGPSGGPNRGMLIGVGAVVLIVVVLLVVMGGDKTGTDAGGGTDVAGSGGGSSGGTEGGGTAPVEPAMPTETAQDVMGEYGTTRPTMLKQYRRFINRLKAIGDEKAQQGLLRVYEDFIKGPGRDDKEAREALGYKQFAYEIPEDISFRKYDYLEAVEAAYNRHWFGPDEMDDYQTAMDAWKETQAHREKLINDHRFLAADSVRSLIAHDKYFKDYYYATRWADPYLICYSSKERLSEYDLLSIEDKEERKQKRKEIAKKKKAFQSILDEKAAIFQGLYKEFRARYEEKLNLKPLMDKYGGRPDYKLGVRSFEYGCPMVIWIFDSRQAFDEYHSKVKQEMIPHNVAGYFSPATGFVYLYDEGDNASNRVFEINKNVHEGTHQLEFWFTRQRNRWAKPKQGQDFFGEGIAEYIGAVQMQKDRSLKFLGINIPRLKGMQSAAKMLKGGGNEYKLFPVDKLVGFNSYGEVQQWGASTWQLNPGLVLGMFYQQSWAFVYFLNEYKNGKYKERFERFFDLVLHRETGFSEGDKAFKEAFRIRDEDDWEDINEEFHEYITDHLMKMDPSKWDYTPPPRGESDK